VLLRICSVLLAFCLTVSACATKPVPGPVTATPVAFAHYTAHAPPEANTFQVAIVPVYIDKNFSAYEKAEIYNATQEWNYALNGYQQYRLENDRFDMETDIVFKVLITGQGLLVLSKPEKDMPSDMPDSALAWVESLGSPVVYVATDRIGTRNLKSIVMHEIGHTLSLEHTKVQGTLMAPYYGLQSPCVDKITVQALSYLRPRWKWSTMNYCEVF
jgi:hypothetical protein